jgi:hypothetical protein
VGVRAEVSSLPCLRIRHCDVCHGCLLEFELWLCACLSPLCASAWDLGCGSHSPLQRFSPAVGVWWCPPLEKFGFLRGLIFISLPPADGSAPSLPPPSLPSSLPSPAAAAAASVAGSACPLVVLARWWFASCCFRLLVPSVGSGCWFRLLFPSVGSVRRFCLLVRLLVLVVGSVCWVPSVGSPPPLARRGHQLQAMKFNDTLLGAWCRKYDIGTGIAFCQVFD